MIRVELIMNKNKSVDDTKKQGFDKFLRILELPHTWLATEDFKKAVAEWKPGQKIPDVKVAGIRDSLMAMVKTGKDLHTEMMKDPPKPIVVSSTTASALDLLYPGEKMTNETGSAFEMTFDALLIPAIHVAKSYVVNPVKNFGSDLASAIDGMKAEVPTEISNQDRDEFMAALVYIFHRIAPPIGEAYVKFMDAATAAFCKKPDSYVIDAKTIVKHVGAESTSIAIATAKEKIVQCIDHLKRLRLRSRLLTLS